MKRMTHNASAGLAANKSPSPRPVNADMEKYKEYMYLSCELKYIWAAGGVKDRGWECRKQSIYPFPSKLKNVREELELHCEAWKRNCSKSCYLHLDAKTQFTHHGTRHSHIIIRLAVKAYVVSPHPCAIPGSRRGVLDPGDEVEHAGEQVTGQHAV